MTEGSVQKNEALKAAKLEYDQGYHHARSGQHQNAISSWTSALKILDDQELRERIDLDPIRADLNANISTCHTELGDYTASARRMRSAIEIYSKPNLRNNVNYELQRVILLTNLAELMNRTRNFRASIQLLERADAIINSDRFAEVEEAAASRVALDLCFGAALINVGQPRDAILRLQRVIRLLDGSSAMANPKVVSYAQRAYANFGIALRSAGMHDLAMGAFSKSYTSLKDSTPLQKVKARISLTLEMAFTRFEKGDFEVAQKLAQEALKTCLNSGATENIGSDLEIAELFLLKFRCLVKLNQSAEMEDEFESLGHFFAAEGPEEGSDDDVEVKFVGVLIQLEIIKDLIGQSKSAQATTQLDYLENFITEKLGRADLAFRLRPVFQKIKDASGHCQAGRLSDALAACEISLETIRDLKATFPSSLLDASDLPLGHEGADLDSVVHEVRDAEVSGSRELSTPPETRHPNGQQNTADGHNNGAEDTNVADENIDVLRRHQKLVAKARFHEDRGEKEQAIAVYDELTVLGDMQFEELRKQIFDNYPEEPRALEILGSAHATRASTHDSRQAAHAQSALKDVLKLTSGPEQFHLAILFAKAVEEREMGRIANSLASLDKLERLLQGAELKDKVGLNKLRHLVKLNTAIGKVMTGESEAARLFRDTIASFADSIDGQNEGDRELIGAMCLGFANTKQEAGDLLEALALYVTAWDFVKETPTPKSSNIGLIKIQVKIGEGNTFVRLGDNRRAVRSFEDARRLLTPEIGLHYKVFDETLTKILINLYNPLDILGDRKAAQNCIREAVFVAAGPTLKDFSEFDLLRALAYGSLGSDCIRSGDPESAIAAFTRAEHYFELVSPTLPNRLLKMQLYVNMFNVFKHIPNRHQFALRVSSEMSRLLEVAPSAGGNPWWNELFELFRIVHARWLQFCLDSNELEQIPLILTAKHGREIANEFLDSEFADSSSGTVTAFQRARRDLRALIEFEGNALPADAFKLRESALREILEAKRAEARDIPGFEVVAAAYRLVDSESVRSKLSKSEALVLLFRGILDNRGTVSGEVYAAVFRGDGGGELVVLPALADKAAEMERFSRSVSGRSGLRDGGWSHARDAGGLMTATAPPDRMTEAQVSSFWSETADAQRANLWGPLTEALAGVERVIGITHGRLQLAALSAGAPTGAEIVQYPGLAFYALARGLYGTRSTVEQSAVVPHIAVVRGEHSDLQYSPVEEQTVTDIWRSTGAEVVASGYPRGERVSLLHVSSHGSLLADGTPVILMGRDETGNLNTLGERDILRGASVDAAFLNLCLGGRLSEDPLDGSPSGLVSALMRRGAKVVVAALPPVDDLWACVLGLMVTEAMATEGLPLDRALAVAKKQLGEGVPEKVLRPLLDWHTARVHHVVLNSQARSKRKSPETCAQVALDAASGRDPDPALQSRLTALLPELTGLLAEAPENDRHLIAARFFAEAAGKAFAERLAQGPGPAEYGALVHGMIAFGESAPAN